MIQTIKIPFGANYIKQGDTIPKILFTFDAGDDIDLTGATIKMQLYYDKKQVFAIETGAGITIVSAKVFEIDEVAKEDNTFPSGVLIGDLEITKGGDRLTYFNIEYSIIKQYTK